MFRMKRWAFLLALTVVFTAAYAIGEDDTPCAYVVKQVSFENTNGLTPEQVEVLRTQVLGRCYGDAKSLPISTYVYDQLLEWGYRKASVYEPEGYRVLDVSTHPTPIAFAIDFLLTPSDRNLSKPRSRLGGPDKP